MKLHVPNQLTDLQKLSLRNLYLQLKNFEQVEIFPSKSVFIKSDFHYDSVDDYFEDYGIDLPGRKM